MKTCICVFVCILCLRMRSGMHFAWEEDFTDNSRIFLHSHAFSLKQVNLTSTDISKEFIGLLLKFKSNSFHSRSFTRAD